MPTYRARKQLAGDAASRKRRKLQVHRRASKLLMHEAALTETLANIGKENISSSGEFASIVDDSGGPSHDEPPSEQVRPTLSLDIVDSDSDGSFVGYEEEEEENKDDEDDFFGSDILSWHDDSKEVEERCESANESSTDSSARDNPAPTMTYDDTDESPPVHEDVDFSDLEVATLELMSLCDRSGARRGFYDKLLTLLQQF